MWRALASFLSWFVPNLQLFFRSRKTDCCLIKFLSVANAKCNPAIGWLNYLLIHLPKIYYTGLSLNGFGPLPAGILSLIAFQWNTLNCRLTAFPIAMITWHEWKYALLISTPYADYSRIRVFIKMNSTEVAVRATRRWERQQSYFLCNFISIVIVCNLLLNHLL